MRFIKEVVAVFLLCLFAVSAVDIVKVEDAIAISSSCGDLECFEENFKECKRSILTLKLTDTTTYQYEILGLKDGLCEVISKFTASPDRALYKKEMSCLYDHSKDFKVESQDISKCQGKLYEVFTGEYEEPVEIEKEAPIKIVSLCDGCMIGGSCIAEGVQKQEEMNGALYYCGADHKSDIVKELGEVCVVDYECEYYYCNNGLCNGKLEGGSIGGILIGVFIAVVIILLAGVFLLYKLGIGFKKITKEEKKMDKEQKNIFGRKYSKIKQQPYKYRAKFDILEKKLKKKFKK